MGVPAGVAKTGVWSKYNTLGFDDRPTAYLDEAPLVDVNDDEAAEKPPYVVITATLERIEPMADLDRIETANVKLAIYAASAPEVQAIADGIMYDGDPANQRSGLDDATALPTLPAGYSLNKCERMDSGLVIQERDRGQTAEPVFRGELNYRVELFFDASA